MHNVRTIRVKLQVVKLQKQFDKFSYQIILWDIVSNKTKLA